MTSAESSITSPRVAERDSHGRFVPGVSGNPGGQSGDARMAIGRARELAPEAVEMLWEIASDKSVNPSTRKDALVALLDRGLGKPRQTVHVDVPGMTRAEEALEGLSDDELEAFVHALPRELEA